MFGADQVVVVGYRGRDGELLCRACAEKQESEGVNIHGEHWFPIIQYTADEWASECAWERSRQTSDDDVGGNNDVVADDYLSCDECGTPIGYSE